MTDPGDAPSAWRLLWSPKAMAWWARYRPVVSLRLGTAAFGLWLGGFIGWFLAIFDKPFATPSGFTFGLGAACCFIVTLLIHGWTWLPVKIPPRQRSFSVLAVIALASIPSTVFDLPDAFFSLYRDAVHYAQFDPANPVWPKLPDVIISLTNTCMWTYLSIGLWLLMAVFATKNLQRLPLPTAAANACNHCCYDLTGTRAAGIGRCPECGAGVPALADGDALASE